MSRFKLATKGVERAAQAKGARNSEVMLISQRNMIRNAYNLALDDPRFAPMKSAVLVKDGKLTEEGIRRGIKL